MLLQRWFVNQACFRFKIEQISSQEASSILLWSPRLSKERARSFRRSERIRRFEMKMCFHVPSRWSSKGCNKWVSAGLTALGSAGLCLSSLDRQPALLRCFVQKIVYTSVMKWPVCKQIVQYDVLSRSGLEWTMVLPPMLTNSRAKGAYPDRRRSPSCRIEPHLSVQTLLTS